MGNNSLKCFGFLFCLFLIPSSFLYAAGKAGDLVQTDMIGTNIFTNNLDTGKNMTISDKFGLSEFVGLHYYFWDEVRLGMAFQFTEAISPSPANNNWFTTFALLPQVGWNFLKPFFAQLTVAVPLRANGKDQVDFGLQGVFGASFPVADGISATLALEIPVYLALEHTIGITPLAGLGFKL